MSDDVANKLHIIMLLYCCNKWRYTYIRLTWWVQRRRIRRLSSVFRQRQPQSTAVEAGQSQMTRFQMTVASPERTHDRHVTVLIRFDFFRQIKMSIKHYLINNQ